jgi:superfamily II DNA or RNA helicase
MALEISPTYRSGANDADPVKDFLEPCLGASDSYDRLSGYFSSRVLALAAEGLGQFLQGSGKMRLIMSSTLTPEDFRGLADYVARDMDYSYLFAEIVNDVSLLTSAIEKNHFEAMCWLLKAGRLEIKVIAFNRDDNLDKGPIFHPKVGIFRDSSNNGVSFSGSVNETAAGWTGNIEEFKVFKSWIDSQKEYFDSDASNFDYYWSGGASPHFLTVGLPQAVRDGLISHAPNDMPNLKPENTELSGAAPSKLRNYQNAAIKAWEANGRLGILAMATGTGKTKTAKGCIESVTSKGTTLIVVSAPYQHIAQQWVAELSNLNPVLATGGSDWKTKLNDLGNLKKLGIVRDICIIGVQNTIASTRFVEKTSELASNFENALFVGDEVHGLGASAFQNALQSTYKLRLGLSATPDRYFDEVGTRTLLDYFKGTVFEFSTGDALSWRDPVTGNRALCDYKYLPHFLTLSDKELTLYDELTAKIGKYSGRVLDKEEQSALETLLYKRAAVVKTASAKIPLLKQLLLQNLDGIEHCLIYCHDMDQLMTVASLLIELGVSYQKITGEESNSPDPRFGGLTERDWIIKQFALGTTRVLLAIKCLDEGVDVPSAKMSYILASSGNPREFIQRRGRLLRPSPDKDFALINDFVVVPSLMEITADNPEEVSDSNSTSILRKEVARIEQLSRDALNADQISEILKPYLKEDDN